MTEMLRQLWKLTGQELTENASDWNGHFEPIGLILHGVFQNADCPGAPTNSVQFASNGGDSIWSLLDVGDGINEASPVVMTVFPEQANVIVGASLAEFLALGCRFGFFTLEDLVYSREEQIVALDSHNFDPDIDETQRRLFVQLSSRFHLEPWPKHAERLTELASKYYSAIKGTVRSIDTDLS